MKVDKKELKANNGYRTLSLFEETNSHPTLLSVYSLKEDDGNFPSAHRIYMNAPTEYHAALELLGSYDHWKTLASAQWFLTGRINGQSIPGFSGLLNWRIEKEAKAAAIAKQTLITNAQNGETAAAKALLTEYNKNHSGRPAKHKKKLDMDVDVNELFDRIK